MSGNRREKVTARMHPHDTLTSVKMKNKTEYAFSHDLGLPVRAQKMDDKGTYSGFPGKFYFQVNYEVRI